MSNTGDDILRHAVEAAQRNGLVADIVPTPQAPDRHRDHTDGLLRIKHDRTSVDYTIEIKRSLPPSAWGSVLQQLERLPRPLMFVSDYIAPELAEQLRSRGIAFLDSAGNTFVRQDSLFMSVQGRKRTTPPRKIVAGRAFQPTGLQVIFTLLCLPDAINLPYRTLATMSGVAHGTVGWVIPDLQKLGFIKDLSGKRGTRRLYDRRRLLDHWVTAYITTLRPRTLLGRFYARSINDWQDWPHNQHAFQWGGEPAAALLTQHLKPGELTLYADAVPSALIARQAFSITPGIGQEVVVDIRKVFWRFPPEPEVSPTVPPLLVYADLLATADARCIETAEILYETHLA